MISVALFKVVSCGARAAGLRYLSGRYVGNKMVTQARAQIFEHRTTTVAQCARTIFKEGILFRYIYLYSVCLFVSFV